MTTTNKSAASNYRIVNSDYTIKYTGTNDGSFFTLEKAMQIVDRKNGESVYEWCPITNRLMWEVL
jgi:hypothetical protein